jgi:ABC-2 type transport system permease protein/lipopolysaccharide transport system permease protein
VWLLWGIVLDGTRAFVEAEGMIHQLAAPLSMHIYAVLWSNLIILAHNIVIYVVVLLWFHIVPGWIAVLSIPGIVLVLLNGLWMGLLFGLLSARFRDIPQIIASLVQVVFFVTPIIWQPEMLKGRTMILDWNPFYHLVEIVRSPLLGEPPSTESCGAVLVILACGWGVTLAFYTVYRWRLAYWV